MRSAMAAATIAVVTIVQMVIWNAISKHKAESNESLQDSSDSELTSNLRSLPRSTRSMRVRSEGALPRRHPLLSNTSHALHQNNATSQETDRISFQNSTKAIGSWEGSLLSAAPVKHAGSNVSSMQPQESSSPAGATGRQISEPDKKYYQDTRRGDDHKVTREVKADSTHTAQILLGVAKGREGGDMRGRDKLRTQAQTIDVTQAPGPANDKVALMSSDDGIRQGRNDSDDQGVSKAGPMEMLSLASTDRDSSARRQTSSGLDNKVPPRSAGVSDPANGNGGTWLTSTKNVELLCSKLSLNSSDSARWKRWKDLRCSCFSSSAASDFVACQFATLQPLANGLVELVRSMKLEVSGSSAMFHTKKILSFGTRVPGDEGWNKTIGYISGFFKALGWFVEEDRFHAHTPLGELPMCNLVASLNPRGGVCLVDLAAHLDSKRFADFR